ncbi:MAG: hypothetical protein M1817_005384 [Caeruleum heppii]|nr:MAG: hypothetical protein M1817_005384 [Caeruleum heppii]
MSQRHIRFRVKELARLAAEAVGANSCTRIEKYPDSMYNKAMLLTMENGSQVVAKVPNPNAGRPHFTTASEVATMDFVYAWSSRAQDNAVGAEYIIMEKLPGIDLERVWSNMNIQDRFAVVKVLADYQKRWTSISFQKFGSLYYAEDLDGQTADSPLYTDQHGDEITNSKFAVGPSTAREFIDHGRATIDFDRGPWDTLENYHSAIGQREIACVSRLARLPKSPVTLCGPGTYQPTRKKKIEALHCHLALLKYILPVDPSIASSCLWHGDLHVANIFVNPSKPTEVVGLIDWQSTELAPLYDHARQPHIIDYDGPPVQGLERPCLPADMATLDPAAQGEAQALFLRQSLCALYKTLIHQRNPRLYHALEFQNTPSFSLLLLARNLLVDGEATYLAQVTELEAIWDTLPRARGATYPLSFSDDERAKIEADLEGAVRGMELMREIQRTIGDLFPEQGIVRSEQYLEALDALGQMRDQVIEEFANDEREREIWRAEWPFGG